jgi:hypothetical protein
MMSNDLDRVVFALTTSGADIFVAMTRIAIASLRLSNPRLNMLVVCDAVSLKALQDARSPILEEVNQWQAIEAPIGSPAYRNRYVKTCLRAVIEGSFLFLDSDIFVRGSLEGLFRIESDIAAAPNHSQDAFHAQLPDHDARMIESLGWQVGSQLYVNGGVILYKDTEGTRRFASTWHERWKHSSRQLSHYRDQPALNAALHEVKPRIQVLTHEYNFQLKWRSNCVVRPHVWHYNYTSRDQVRTHFEALAEELHRGAPLDMHCIAELAAIDQPWTAQEMHILDRKESG